MSPTHRENAISCVKRSRGVGLIDSALAKGLDSERKYWSDVLKRVIAVVKFLGSSGLAFRGSDETLESN
jgi:hypothetical protein